MSRESKSGWTSPQDEVGVARHRLRERLNAAAAELRAAVAEAGPARVLDGKATRYMHDALGLVVDAERVFRFDRRPVWICAKCGPTVGARCGSCGSRRAHRAVGGAS